MMSRAPDRDAERLTREFAELSRVITDRCGAVFEAARRGGPERHGLDQRGDDLQALQNELARHMPAATSGDIAALYRVVDIQHHTLALLDTLQAWPSHTSGYQVPMFTPDPVFDIVTMRPSPGPAGETLWVADPPSARPAATPLPSAAVQSPQPAAQPTREAKPEQKIPAQPPTTKKQPATRPLAASASVRNRTPKQPDPVAKPEAEEKPRLGSLPRHVNIALQLAAAAAVVATLVLVTASLVGPIAGRLGSQTAEGTEQERRKPAERLSQAVATASTTATPAAAVQEAPAPPPPAPIKGNFVAIVSTHATYAAAREAFVTLKGLYPVPMARTAPDIQGIKALIGSERFQLGLLPALTKSDAEDLCRRLTGLGHPTCQVKPQS